MFEKKHDKKIFIAVAPKCEDKSAPWFFKVRSDLLVLLNADKARTVELESVVDRAPGSKELGLTVIDSSLSAAVLAISDAKQA